MFGLAFAALCLGPALLRVAALLFVPVCGVVWLTASQPDLRVSEAGVVAFWSEGQDVLYVNRPRSDRYGQEQFIRRAGHVDVPKENFDDDRADCDPLGCRFVLKSRTISVTPHPSEVLQECRTADLVILTQREAGPRARYSCEAMLIDVRVLKEGGAQNIYIRPSGLKIQPAKTKARAARPWGH